ncbi:hypothetical protein H696_05931 [Fonticula alba]|uniref:J domain-containing protein n=1 Tax=Fonticula alba TaxID=691883 RepID=A0A058Z049_FONAL|nr:hypothetical protein H696_05931 [Fonticula alba]KCV67644.1 hypothetical protein H696_05931 [Fonticula alba]|eukprot:XP_009497982.1 hypothetical protein H696_05931 [Fonticula alba]
MSHYVPLVASVKVKLPALPESWAADKTHQVSSTLETPATRSFEPVGAGYISRLVHPTRCPIAEAVNGSGAAVAAKDEMAGLNPRFDELYDESVPEALLAADPAEYRTLDMYQILGLGNLRRAATEADIRTAHRRRVLVHHPDKQAQALTGDTRDNFFKCIQRALDVLVDPTLRMHFDSCDPTFNERLPAATLPAKADFFEVYGPVFAANAHFSVRQPVPALGNMDTPLDEVQAFYEFWYAFESWRVFNWRDKEGTMSDGGSRDDKRWTDQQNRRAREEAKTKDNARLRTLVDQAAALDPRMKLLREAEKKRREEQKRSRQQSRAGAAGALAAQKAAAEKAAAEKAAAEAAEAAAQKAAAAAAAEAERKGREDRKKIAKKERKTLRGLMRDHACFLSGEEASPLSKAHQQATINLELFLEKYDVMDLEKLNRAIEAASDFAAKGALYFAALDATLGTAEASRNAATAAAAAAAAASTATAAAAAAPEWTDAHRKVLVHAIKTFPGGTTERWTKITEHVNTQCSTTFTEKQVVAESKAMESGVGSVTMTDLQFERRQGEVKIADAPTQRSDLTDADMRNTTAPASTETPWSAAELDTLVHALRTVPATDADRWGKIAAFLPDRPRQSITAKIKELHAMKQQK